MTDIDWPRVVGFVAAVVVVWQVAGRLKQGGRVLAGDARKLNHVAALCGGAVMFGWLPEPVARASCYAGMAVAFGLLLVMCSCRDRPLFRTMFAGYARESDAPYEAFHVWYSWFVSIVGLVVLDQCFRDMTITRTSALVLGLADGVAEPVGVRWGRHRYRVPSLTGSRPVFRSWEGSAAVFLATVLVLVTARDAAPAAVVLLTAAVVTVVEAVSPHGLDNLTISLSVGVVLSLTEPRV